MKVNNKGITIISLVITIIILLILASISIIALTLNNGLFLRAKQAKENTLIEQNQENIILSDYEKMLDEHSNGSRINSEELKQICDALNTIGVETEENETIESICEKIKLINNKKVTSLVKNGTGITYSNVYKFYITDYDNYANLTIDNIKVQLNNNSFRDTQLSDLCGKLQYNYSYDSATGCITVTLDGTKNHQSWDYPQPNATITIIE